MKSFLVLLILVISRSFAQTADSDSIKLAQQIHMASLGVEAQDDTTLAIVKVKYDKFLLEHRMDVYKWQLTSSKIIFIVVNLIVLIGLYLSFLQFKKSTMSKVEALDHSSEASKTKLEITKEGLKIDSAVIGLIILVISIAFYFLYLNYAFGINDPTIGK